MKPRNQSNPYIVAAFRFAFRVGVAISAGFILVAVFGPSVPSSGVGELERSILELNGFLLAFVGVFFTGMVAEVRSHPDLDPERRRNLSRALRWEALGAFSLLILALSSSVSVTVLALSPPFNVTIPVALAEIFPLAFTVMGLTFLAYALAQYATMDYPKDVGESEQAKRSETDSTANSQEPASTSSGTTSDLKASFDREEKRLLVALGFLGLAVVFRPSIPFASVAVAAVGVPFYGVLAAWGGYALCMLIYFSNDIFDEGWRRRAHRVGLMLLFALPVFIVTFGFVLYVAATTGNPLWTDGADFAAALIDAAALISLARKVKQ